MGNKSILKNKRILIALLCGAAAALALSLSVNSALAQAAASRETTLAAFGGEQVDVFVASRDIAVGETLDESNVALTRWLAALLPQGALTRADEVLGKTAQVSLLKNEPVAQAKLGAVNKALSVPDGFCALSVPSQDVLAVGGAIGVGSIVDVYANGAAGVTLLASDVLVLATNNKAQSASGEADSGGFFGSSTSKAALSWVTLAVPPERVSEFLAAAQGKNLSFVLPGSLAAIGGESNE
jgi:pilus assembly protein CpaB